MLMSGQVTGDLWERYMVMLTQENKLEVYACPFHARSILRPSHCKIWTKTSGLRLHFDTRLSPG